MAYDEAPWRDEEGWWKLGEAVERHPHYKQYLYYKHPYRVSGKNLDYRVSEDYRSSGNDDGWTDFSEYAAYRTVKRALRPGFKNGSPVAKKPHVEKNYQLFAPVYKSVRSGRVASIANARRMQVRFNADAQLARHMCAAVPFDEGDDDDCIPNGTPMILELEFRCNRPLHSNIRARLPRLAQNTYGPDLINPIELEVYREVSRARLIDTRTGKFVPGWVPYNNDETYAEIRERGTDCVMIGVPRFVAWTGPYWRLLLDQAEQSDPPMYNFLGLDGRDVGFRYSQSLLPCFRVTAHPATIVPDDLFTYDEERKMEPFSLADVALAAKNIEAMKQRWAQRAWKPHNPPGVMYEKQKAQYLPPEAPQSPRQLERQRSHSGWTKAAACVPNLSGLRL